MSYTEDNPNCQWRHLQAQIASAFGAAMLCLLFAAQASAGDLARGKTLRCVFPAAETSFDPAASHDFHSAQVIQSIFETLYTFDYLARPVKLIPQTAAALPRISDGGKTYTIQLKRGIYFPPDPSFEGKPRELSMADYVYSYKRLMDPAIQSPHSWLFEGKIRGLDAAAQSAKTNGRFDYDADIAGLELLDPYTLRIHLTGPDFNLGQILAHHPTAAVARQVVERYRDAQGHVGHHPVGTGPYQLTEWRRGSRMVLEARPAYRGRIWDFQPGTDPEDRRVAAQMRGKRLPQIARIDIAVILEDQSRWLAFQDGQIDVLPLSAPLAPLAIADGKLKPAFAQKGIGLSRMVEPKLSFHYWNMQDPLVGGLSKEKIALRRAIAMAYDIGEEIRLVWNGEAVSVNYPIPPGVTGHDAHYKSLIRYDPQTANALLDKFSYRKGADGWRTQPDGRPLQIRYATPASSLGKLQSEMWKRTFDRLGIRMISDTLAAADLLQAGKQCRLQMRTAAWSADYPDGDNFMQLFYGPHIGKSNNSCTSIPAYDALYRQTKKMAPGSDRDALYHRMARLLDVNATQIFGYARYTNTLTQPRVLGYKKHPVLATEWMYLDIDKAE